MLVLPIKKKWFDMIISGEKKEEYREIKPYYDIRFKKYMPRSNNFRNEYISSEFFIVFRNGYNYNSPSVKCRCVVDIGTGKEKWGAIPGKRYYVLKIIEIIEIRNLRELDTFEKMKDKLIKNLSLDMKIGIDLGKGESISAETIKVKM